VSVVARSTTGNTGTDSPTFTPDGQYVAFLRDVAAYYTPGTLMTYAVADGTLRTVASSVKAFAVAPSSDTLLYTTQQTIYTPPDALLADSLATGVSTTLATGLKPGASYGYAHSGARVFFVRDPSVGDVETCLLDGSGQKTLVTAASTNF